MRGIARPMTMAQDARSRMYPDAANDAVSHLDDIGYRVERRSNRRGVVFTLLGALVFALLGAGLYAMSGWPWQNAASAVSALRQTSPEAPPPRPEPPPAPSPVAASPAPQPSAAPPARPSQAEPPAAPLLSTAPVELPPAPIVPPPALAPPSPPPAPVAPPQLMAAPQPPAASAAPQQLTAVIPQPTTAPPPRPEQGLTQEQRAESQRFINRADSILRNTNDIAAARLFLERAANTGDGQALFRLAETYDPDWLTVQRARGVTGDVARARSLYQRAADLGVPAARARLATLP